MLYSSLKCIEVIPLQVQGLGVLDMRAGILPCFEDWRMQYFVKLTSA
jgi:hypothetical protein